MTFERVDLSVPIDAPFKLRNIGFNYGSEFAYFASSSPNFCRVNLETLSVISSGAASIQPNSTCSGLGPLNSGKWLSLTGTFGDTHLLRYSSDFLTVEDLQDFGGVAEQQDDIFTLIDGDGAEHWLTVPHVTNNTFFIDGASANLATATGISQLQPKSFFVDKDGDIWAYAATSNNNQTTAYFYRLITTSGSTNPQLITVSGLPNRASGTDDIFDHAYQALHYRSNSADHFVFYWVGKLYAVNVFGNVTATSTLTSIQVNVIGKQIRWHMGGNTIWVYGNDGAGNEALELSLEDLTLITAHDFSATGPWGTVQANSDSGFIYAVVADNRPALIAPGTTTDVLQILYLGDPPIVADKTVNLIYGNLYRLPCFTPCVPHTIRKD